MKEFITLGYSYNELSEEAKEAVKQWYLDDPIRNDIFSESVESMLSEEFPRSKLKVHYSLSYCQGDGLNIHGTINLYDFLEKWEISEKSRRTMEYYIDNSLNVYTFEKNNRYCYSCKFIDRKYIGDTISEFTEELNHNSIRGIKNDIIKAFFIDMFDYFENLDDEWENAGYKYFYECENEEVEDFCNANDYYFTEEGRII